MPHSLIFLKPVQSITVLNTAAITAATKLGMSPGTRDIEMYGPFDNVVLQNFSNTDIFAYPDGNITIKFPVDRGTEAKLGKCSSVLIENRSADRDTDANGIRLVFQRTKPGVD